MGRGLELAGRTASSDRAYLLAPSRPKLSAPAGIAARSPICNRLRFTVVILNVQTPLLAPVLTSPIRLRSARRPSPDGYSGAAQIGINHFPGCNPPAHKTSCWVQIDYRIQRRLDCIELSSSIPPGSARSPSLGLASPRRTHRQHRSNPIMLAALTHKKSVEGSCPAMVERDSRPTRRTRQRAKPVQRSCRFVRSRIHRVTPQERDPRVQHRCRTQRRYQPLDHQRRSWLHIRQQ